MSLQKTCECGGPKLCVVRQDMSHAQSQSVMIFDWTQLNSSNVAGNTVRRI